MRYTVVFYGSSQTRKGYVEKFIEDECPDEVAHEILEKISLLEKYPIGQCLRDSKVFEKVVGYHKRIDLYELKVRFRLVKYRLLFTIKEGFVYFLHAFIKTNSKDMQRNFEVAFDRGKNL